jgi:hypothetical protein
VGLQTVTKLQWHNDCGKKHQRNKVINVANSCCLRDVDKSIYSL